MEWFEAIRERRSELGLSQAEVARRVGVSQGAIDKIEKGRVTFSRYTPLIAEVLGLDLSGIGLSEAASKAMNIPVLSFRKPAQTNANTIEIFQSIEDTVSGEVQILDSYNTVDKPWFLGNSTNSYGIMIEGDSMIPIYEPGDVVIVNTGLPVRRWSTAFIIRDGSNGKRGIIRRVLEWTKTDRVIGHYDNGELIQETLPRDGWKEAHRIVAKVEVV